LRTALWQLSAIGIVLVLVQLAFAG
jgi:hypothetical protein